MITILKAENLRKIYKLGSLLRRIKIDALDDVNLVVQSDEPVIISLVGESGSGKTTLAKVILRLVEPTSGSAVIYDQVVAGEGDKPGHHQFLGRVQPIFQNPFEAISSYRTVDSYLQTTAQHVNGLSATDAIGAMESALSSVGLKYPDVRGKYSDACVADDGVVRPNLRRKSASTQTVWSKLTNRMHLPNERRGEESAQ